MPARLLDHAGDGSRRGYDFESVTFTPTDTTDYNTVTGTVTVTVRQGNTDSDGLADSRRHHLRPDSVLVGADGRHGFRGRHVRLDHADDRSRCGYDSESVTFTPTDTTDYNTVTGSVTVTVNKATPTVTAWPTAGAITYRPDSGLVGADGWHGFRCRHVLLDHADDSPAAGTPSESVTFTPSDTTDYNTVTGSVTVTVNKATPTVTAWPTASAITYGQTLSSSTLTGGTASVAGTFCWTTATTAPGCGCDFESVTFTPKDTTDYNTVTGSVTVTVNKATPTVTSGRQPAPSPTARLCPRRPLTGGTASVAGTFSWTTPTTAPRCGYAFRERDLHAH